MDGAFDNRQPPMSVRCIMTLSERLCSEGQDRSIMGMAGVLAWPVGHTKSPNPPCILLRFL